MCDNETERQERDVAVQARVKCGYRCGSLARSAGLDVQEDQQRGSSEAYCVGGVPDPTCADPRAAENADAEQSYGDPEQQSAVIHAWKKGRRRNDRLF